MIELDGITVRLIGRRQRDTHRGFLFVPIIEEHDVLGFKLTRGMPIDEFLNPLREHRVQLEHDPVSRPLHWTTPYHRRSMSEV
ncbi:Uncharacterised protein [Mycobacteroides abscessus subsp. abscessus]|nr:Uncharacterised protein [Mycobacteroides abscessus subsp. abscessus]